MDLCILLLLSFALLHHHGMQFKVKTSFVLFLEVLKQSIAADDGAAAAGGRKLSGELCEDLG